MWHLVGDRFTLFLFPILHCLCRDNRGKLNGVRPEDAKVPNATVTNTHMGLFSLLLPRVWRGCFCNSCFPQESAGGEQTCLPLLLHLPLNGRTVAESHLAIAASLPRSVMKILFCTLNAIWAPYFSCTPLTRCVVSYLFNQPRLETSDGLR